MAAAGSSESNPRFFASSAAFRKWLGAYHDKAPVLWIGFWKAHTGRKGLTYPEAVDQALCFGWIDGLKKRYDDAAFVQRFTPRKPTSIWSAINLAKVEALKNAGLMTSAGFAVHAARDPRRAGKYSFEQRGEITLDAALAKRFRAQKEAWRFFEAQLPATGASPASGS